MKGCKVPALARGLCSAHYQQAKAAGRLDEIAPNPSTSCEQCGQPIPEGRRWGARFCSVACKDAASDAKKHAALLDTRAARVQLCPWCKEPLSADLRFGSRFCSRACGIAWENHQKALSAQRAKRAARQPCAVCGEPIPDSRNAGAIYCSQECKNRSQRSVSVRARRGQQEYNRRYLYGLSDEQYQALLASQDGRCAICGTNDWNGKIKNPHVDHDHSSGEIRGLLCGGCNNGLGNFKDDPARLRAAAEYLERAIVPAGVS